MLHRFVKEAVETAVEKEEGWSSAGENSDGGAPVPVISSVPKVKKSQTWEQNNIPASSSKKSRGPWKSTSSPPDDSWGASKSRWTTASQYVANNDWGARASHWGQNGKYNSQWGSNNDSYWEEAAPTQSPEPSQLSAVSFPPNGSYAHPICNGRSGPWRSESAPSHVSGPAVVPYTSVAAGSAKLEQLMKDTSIAK